jgi:Fe-S-cluster containining protein
MSDLCSECGGKCCVGIIDVYSSDEIFYDETLCCDVEGKDYDREMITNDKNQCIALKNGRCSIYEKRPQVCRLFEVNSSCCEGFRSGRITVHNNNPRIFSCKIKL